MHSSHAHNAGALPHSVTVRRRHSVASATLQPAQAEERHLVGAIKTRADNLLAALPARCTRFSRKRC